MTPTKEQIQAASKCSTVKEALELLFPDAFKEEEEYFDFGDSFTISSRSYENHIPLFIGYGFAPKELMKKCLVVSADWHIRVEEHSGNKIIIPFKKKP